MQSMHSTALAKAWVEDEKLQLGENFDSVFHILSAGTCSAVVDEWSTQVVPQQPPRKIKSTLQG